MQCKSYLPLYYTHNDRNVDPNGSTRSVYTGHARPPTSHFSQKFLDFGVPEGFYVGYDKESLRQTILQQEVTFKGQVQELHRLYRRQRELLDEIRRTNFYKKNVLSEVQWLPNLLTSNISFSSDQKAARSIPFDSSVFSRSSASAANIVQTPWTSTKGDTIKTASPVSINVRSSNTLNLSLSQSNVARRKPLDLQLPADEYINNTGKESLYKFDVSRVSASSTHAYNRDCPLAPLGNTEPLFVSSSPTTVSSQIIDLAKFSGSKHISNRYHNDCPDKKKLKMCKDMEIDNTTALRRWQASGEDGQSRSSLNSSSWYNYSESLQRLAEAAQAHQTAPLLIEKNNRVENGSRITDSKVLGSLHEMLDLNTPGQVGASHKPIMQFPAAHSGKVNPPVPFSSSSGQMDLTLKGSFISQAVPYFSPKFSAIKSQASCVVELDCSSRCGDIHEKGRSLQVSCSESNVKATAASSSGILFQSYKCDLASANNETAKRVNRFNSIDLNCSGVAVLNGFSANSREKVDDLTSPELVSSQVLPSSSVVTKEKHMGGRELQHVANILDPSTFNRLHGSCDDSANADQEKTEQNKNSRLFDINLPCDLTPDNLRLEDELVVNGHKHSNLINLGSNVKDDQMSPSSRKVTEVDLEASIMPISPEKKECPPPRGESKEKKTETSLQLSTREDGESLDELMKIAVDVLVSISSSEAQQNSTDFVQCQASSNEMLSWFAGVVCSMEQGDGFLVPSSKDVEKYEIFSSSTGIDYFEAMTLKLTETSEEDYWSNTKTPLNEKETWDVPFLVESSRDRPTKRLKRKNFQREVLPSLASLSRYEVSEDIQIIERLMEAAGTPLHMGVKTRKLGRKGRLGGRKKMHSNAATTTATPCESRICLLALPQMGIPAIDLKDKGRLRWENMPRQPRGKRCPTVFPNITLSQEGWMKKWGGIGFDQKGKKKLKQVQMLVSEES